MLRQDLALPGGAALRCHAAAAAAPGGAAAAAPRLGMELRLPTPEGTLKLKWRS